MFGLIIQKLLKDVDPHHGKERDHWKNYTKSKRHFMVNKQFVSSFTGILAILLFMIIDLLL